MKIEGDDRTTVSTEAETTLLTPDLIAQAPGFSMPRVSPDGKSIAYVRSLDGRSDLWVVPTGGGSASLVTGDMATVSGQPNAPFAGGYGRWFCWSPDSEHLVHTAAGDGQLYLGSPHGGTQKRLTDDPGKHLNPSVTPDGATVVCVVDRGDVDGEIFIGSYALVAVLASVRRLTPDSVVALDPVPSPDGSSIACVTYRLNDRWAHHSRIAVVDLASGDLKELTPTDDIVNCRPRWSPDGSTIGFLSDRSGFLNVWNVPVRGGEATPIAAEAFEHVEFAWSGDGSHIAYLRNENAEIDIRVVDLTGGKPQTVSLRRGIYRELSWAGTSVVALHQSPVRPPSIVAIDVESGEERTIADSAIDGLDDADTFVMPEHVTWSSPDGLDIPGLLFLPRRIVPGGHPVLVHLHGGPTAQSLMGWDPIVQYFVTRGWVVVQPNYRGSTGYGREYADRLHGVWGLADVEDNIACFELLRDRNLIDEGRVVVWGGSAGGYGVLTSLTVRPDVYAAGVDLYGISDWTTMQRDGDCYIHYLADTELGPRETHLDLWIERSPINHVNRISKPLQIFQGTSDPRVPKSQSDAMVAAMQLAGKPVEYHVYEGESHGWTRVSTIQDYITQMERFLAENVLNARS